ncbi:3'(2'),5'-bisphosphate nucleotidase [alpha proteobacterium U9-1i]|nr:3'(2'),5'-bisphosphate nucleotidase [alpha proteobacterium U9-1i]
MTYPSLSALISLAREAGDEIMRVRAEGFDAIQKGDGSLVTIADQRAEAIIEAGLAHLAPGVPMIGEEAVAAGRMPECGDNFFCVDPLDGTRGFVSGGEEFTVNIALIENHVPIVGVVYSPVSGEMFAAEPGRALKGDVAISTTQPGVNWRLVASERSGRNARTQDFANAIGPHTLLHASSSIKFCRLAEGVADLYPRFGDLSEWDAAAGHAILAAAGGGVMRLDGAPLHYGNRADAFLIHGLIAYASEAAKEAALNALR